LNGGSDMCSLVLCAFHHFGLSLIGGSDTYLRTALTPPFGVLGKTLILVLQSCRLIAVSTSTTWLISAISGATMLFLTCGDDTFHHFGSCLDLEGRRLLKHSNMPTEVVNKRCVWNAWLLWHCVADCFTEWAGLVHGCGAVWVSEPMKIPLIPFCLH
jgi:hypothetical protein